MAMKILKTIYSEDKSKRVNFAEKSNGHFSFEEEHLSEKPLEISWLPTPHPSSIYDSLDTAIREAKSSISWLKEEWGKIDT